MVLNTCPERAVTESPELPHHHPHPLRALDVCICGGTNVHIKDLIVHKLVWADLSDFLANDGLTNATKTDVWFAQQRNVLYIMSFDTERMTVKHTDRTSHDTDPCWYTAVWGTRCFPVVDVDHGVLVRLETEQYLQPKAQGQTGPFKMRFQKYAGLIYHW